jgi:hypothetical protein
MLLNRSGCADSNRGPPGPKPGALPTAPHPVKNLSTHLVMYAHYSMVMVMCQVSLVFSTLVTPLEYEEIPAC